MATDSVARALALSAGGGSNLPSIESGDAGKVLKVNQQETGTYWGDDGNEPDAYIKNASVENKTLTLTKKDDTTVTFTDTGSVVSGTDDGTNWSTITIDGTTKAIPSGAEGAPTLVITLQQVISQNPIQLQFTNEQAAIIEDTGIIVLGLDLTQLGMSVNYWKKTWLLDGYICLDAFVDPYQTHGLISYDTSTNIGEYTTQQLQNKLTAGSNITISGDVISATGGGSSVIEAGTGTDSVKQKISNSSIVNTVSASYAAALGYKNSVSGMGAFVSGAENNALSDNAVVAGMNNYVADQSRNLNAPVVLGKQNSVYGLGSSTSYGSYYIGGVAIGTYTRVGGKLVGSDYDITQLTSVALGAANMPVKDAEWWSPTKTYNTGDLVIYSRNISTNDIWYIYRSKVDNNVGMEPAATNRWEQSGYDMGHKEAYLLTVGNGSFNSYTNKLQRSNALAIDYQGNTEIAGTVTAENIPAAPASDGNYVLKCSIVSGVATYSWEVQA